MKMNSYIYIMLLIFLGANIEAQVYLQIEQYNSPHTIKFQVGDELWIKTYEDDEYDLMEIEEIMIEEDVVIFDSGFLALESIKEVRMERRGAEPLSNLLMGFGVTWFAFAGILELTDNWDFGTDTAIIGGTAIGSGFLIKKTMSKRKYKMGKNARLRIIDLRIR